MQEWEKECLKSCYFARSPLNISGLDKIDGQYILNCPKVPSKAFVAKFTSLFCKKFKVHSANLHIVKLENWEWKHGLFLAFYFRCYLHSSCNLEINPFCNLKIYK